MNQYGNHLLDIPNEILIIILKKLGNIDVLYSLFGINNKRIDALIEDDVFTNILNFAGLSLTTDEKLDRFFTFILPRKHNCIKKLILDPTFIEPILRVGDYPNLQCLELCNFRQEIFFRSLTDGSIFRDIFKRQITDLIIHNNDDKSLIEMSCETYNEDVYAILMLLFQNLKHLSIVASSITDYPPLSLYFLHPTAYFSSTLTVLCIQLWTFDDCLGLLDGRLENLTTFIVQIYYIDHRVITPNTGELHKLKCFSLTSYSATDSYDLLVLPLLHRMKNLEKLTLYLLVNNQRPRKNFINSFNETNPFIDGIHLQNQILIYMPQLHAFIFYICTRNKISHLANHKSTHDIQQTFTNMKYGQTNCIIEYCRVLGVRCHVYSLPFTFTRMENITNGFPNIIFDTVTHLSVDDYNPLQHEFYMRISQAFPLLKFFSIRNNSLWSWYGKELKYDESSSDTIIEYSHLISLDIMDVHIEYVLQFLLETKTYLPRLTELKVKYNQLQTATNAFTRDTTRRNCSKVKRLIVEKHIHFTKDVYQYFPSL